LLYKGAVAVQDFAADMKNSGVSHYQDDLAAYRAELRKPIHGTYRGYDITVRRRPAWSVICL